jgi:4-amino-4-deoxy-L-arabinose transferase-like glycosyltransferase
MQFFRLIPFKALTLGILAFVLLRIILLPVSPPGFFSDEAATGAHVVSMLQSQTDANGQSWPLFSVSLGGGYTTPTYLYPLTAWAAIFGPSELSIRYFSEFSTLLAILFLALGVRFWLGTKVALITGLVALALPWNWLQGSLAWDPAMVPLFVTLSFASFSAILFSRYHPIKIAATVFLPIALIALTYVYPPCRITAPILYVLFYVILYYKKAISLRTIVISSFGSLLLVLPLLFFMLQPASIARSKELSVFYDTPLLEAIGQVFYNFFLLLNPSFLFLAGDPNLRHATGLQGMLGLAALPAAIGLVYWIKKTRPISLQRPPHLLALIGVIGVLAAILGSALTNEGQPHSLRASAAWPFFAILLTLGWHHIVTAGKRIIMYGAIGWSLIASLVYIVDFTFYYPGRASSAFDTSIRDSIYHNQPVDYPALSQKYYQNK